MLSLQEHEGRVTKIIDRLAGDLRHAYADTPALSPRNF
jgi:hypothetical protein